MKSIVLALVVVLALAGSVACGQSSSLAPSYPKLTVTPSGFQVWTQTDPHFFVSGGDGHYNWRRSFTVGDGMIVPLGANQVEAEFRGNSRGVPFSAFVSSGDGQELEVTGVVQ